MDILCWCCISCRNQENRRGVAAFMKRSAPYPVGDRSSSSTGNELAELGCPGRNSLAVKNQPIHAAQSGDVIYYREFRYKVLAKATGNFSKRTKLGQGRAGAVFRGSLLGDDGLETLVVIKRFHATVGEEASRHIRCLKYWRPLLHRNLILLLGYCVRKRKLYLVYSYSTNGSLERHLFVGPGNSPTLDWARRYSIIAGVAAGLNYLHSNSSVHGSVSVTNILLDQDFTARLGDFGYSRLAASSSSSSDRHETPYLLDVFHFGKVVLEVACGRRSHSGGIPDGYTLLADWVWCLYGEGRILDAVDPDLAACAGVDKDVATKLLIVGLACTHPHPLNRPSMQKVVEHLQQDTTAPLVEPSTKPRSSYAPAESHVTVHS